MCWIKHQTQPTDNSCVAACIAMACNKPVKEIMAKFHNPECGIAFDETISALADEGVPSIQYASGSFMPWGRTFLITVPSLNAEAMNHAVIIHANSSKDGITIYDPNDGREGKKVYGRDCDLKCYAEIVEIFPPEEAKQ